MHCEQGEVGMKHNYRGWFAKPISVLLAALLLCGTTGCNGDNKPDSITDSPSEVFDPVPVPEDGWTAESLSKTIRINGKALPEPFTCEGLGDGYKLKNDNGYMFLYFNNKYAAQVRFKDQSRDVDNSKEMDMIAVSNDRCKDKSFVAINGIHIGSTRAEAESALGKPTVEYELEKNILWDFSESGYDDEEYFLVLHFDGSDDAISIIAFYFK